MSTQLTYPPPSLQLSWRLVPSIYHAIRQKPTDGTPVLGYREDPEMAEQTAALAAICHFPSGLGIINT